MKKILIIISLFIVITLMVVFIPSLGREFTKNGKLYINEIVAKNNNIIKDNYNEYSDYIELYNGYNNDINLEGYYLSDSEFDTTKWQFKDITIKAGEYLIIYASNKDICDLENRICHTNFKLSDTGEVLTLFDKNGNIVSKIKYPNLDSNISYGFKNGKYIKLHPTPGYENSEAYTVNNKDYNLVINEYMTHNQRNHYDSYGNYLDWVEIYNDSDSDITLDNVYVSDDKNNLTKFKIPIVTIKAFDYLLIYFDSNGNSYENGIYADFGLSDNDENIVISNGSDIIDIVDIVKLEDNISYGKTNDGWKYFTSPTPSLENNTKAFDTIGGSYGNS